ncbi:MAG: Ribosome-binding factor A [Elusimicrobia bacterium]|nr:Ribosome-binding factor A [Elusimicrobiota bacterium]
MHPRRLARLNELIHQKVSESTLNLKDPGIGFITITGSEISPDVATAKIFYSVLGTPAEREATAEALERAKPHIRRSLGELENLRRIPQLIFVYDESIERSAKVSELLNKIHNEPHD